MTNLLSCKQKNSVNQPAIDEQIITQYIADNKLDAKATGTGLYYVITNAGTGSQPNINSNVTKIFKIAKKIGRVKFLYLLKS